jgi:hypothetical protein
MSVKCLWDGVVFELFTKSFKGVRQMSIRLSRVRTASSEGERPIRVLYKLILLEPSIVRDNIVQYTSNASGERRSSRAFTSCTE